MQKVEGAAAGYYVAALMESARPSHRGLNTARLARDARLAVSRRALGRLHLACRTVRGPLRVRLPYARYVERGTGRRPTRPRAAARGSTKPRLGAAA